MNDQERFVEAIVEIKNMISERRNFWKTVRPLPGLIILLLMACNEPDLESNWRTAPSEEPDSVWITSSVYSITGKNIMIGLQNDADNLYVLLKATDRQTQAKIMRTGLTVWLDSAGKKNKTFGVRYPLGMQARREFQPMDGRQGDDRQDLGKRFGEMADSLDIFGPTKNEVNRVSIRDHHGLAVLTSNNNGTMTYELKISLKPAADFGYALNVSPGSSIALGLETGKPVRQEPNRRERAKEPGGEDGGHGDGFGDGGFGSGFGGHGGPYGRREGRRPREEQGNSEPLNFWAKVTLAGNSFKAD